MASDLYGKLTYDDLDCQKKIICEFMDEPEMFGKLENKIVMFFIQIFWPCKHKTGCFSRQRGKQGKDRSSICCVLVGTSWIHHRWPDLRGCNAWRTGIRVTTIIIYNVTTTIYNVINREVKTVKSGSDNVRRSPWRRRWPRKQKRWLLSRVCSQNNADNVERF